MSELEAPLTLSARMIEQLRSDIISCRLEPGVRLRLDELRKRYNVGASPLREALMRLEAEGLVLLAQNKGFRVAPVSREHLKDLTANRIEMEALALRWSIERGSVGWEADVVAAFHRLSRQQKSLPKEPHRVSEQWKIEHRAFHTSLVSACGSPLLLSYLEALFDQAERYVSLSISRRIQPRNDVDEHEALMRAVLARNLAKAQKLMRQHIELTTEKVMAMIDMVERAQTRSVGQKPAY